MTATVEAAPLTEVDVTALPPLPKIAQEVLATFGDEFIDGNQVVSVIEGDPGLCARLLGIANSAYYSLADPLDSVQAAVTRVIGVETVRSLVLALTIQQAFNSKACPGFDAERFWRHSLFCAQNCSDIARQDEEIDDMSRQLAYSTGLCHNLGLMALAHLAPERTSRALKLHGAEPEHSGLSNHLHQLLGTDHRHMTATLASQWALPETLTQAYRYRAGFSTAEENRLGPILEAATVGAANMDASEEQTQSLEEPAAVLNLEVEKLEELTRLSGRKKDGACNLANRMAV